MRTDQILVKITPINLHEFVYLLGSPLLIIDQRPVAGLRQKSRALIHDLAAPRIPMTRDKIEPSLPPVK